MREQQVLRHARGRRAKEEVCQPLVLRRCVVAQHVRDVLKHAHRQGARGGCRRRWRRRRCKRGRLGASGPRGRLVLGRLALSSGACLEHVGEGRGVGPLHHLARHLDFDGAAIPRLDGRQEHEDEHGALLYQRHGFLVVFALLVTLLPDGVSSVHGNAAAQERLGRLWRDVFVVEDGIAQLAQRAAYREVRQQRQSVHQRLGTQPVDEFLHCALAPRRAKLRRARGHRASKICYPLLFWAAISSALALSMHPAAVALGILTLCALLCRTFRLCARRQRDAFLDHERTSYRLVLPRRFSYQTLPTTVVV